MVRARLVGISLVAGVAAACGPAVSVDGLVALGAGVDPSQYSRLILRVETVDGSTATLEDEEILDLVGGVPQRGGVAAAFPVSFSMGRLSALPPPEVRVSAFLCRSASGTAPMSGDAAATLSTRMSWCSAVGGCCGSPSSLALQLQPVP